MKHFKPTDICRNWFCV